MFALIAPEQLPQTYNWVALVLHERQGEATTLSRRAAFKKNGRYACRVCRVCLVCRVCRVCRAV